MDMLEAVAVVVYQALLVLVLTVVELVMLVQET
jgi:hypothetical protein